MIEILKPDFTFSDERGSLVQLVHENYSQVNVLYNKQGSIRGKHYHKISREAFYVISGKVNLELTKNDIYEKYCFSEGNFFLIVPFTVHSMCFSEDCVLIALYDKPIENNGTKDIYKEGEE